MSNLLLVRDRLIEIEKSIFQRRTAITQMCAFFLKNLDSISSIYEKKRIHLFVYSIIVSEYKNADLKFKNELLI